MLRRRRSASSALASDPDRAKVALANIGALFRIERTIADSPRKKKEEARRAKARPIVEKLFEWCDAQVDLVLDETPISAGITYARNQRIEQRETQQKLGANVFRRVLLDLPT